MALSGAVRLIGRAGAERRAESPPYAELHCHSNYSFLDGASQPIDLAKRARAIGLRALAITDHEGVYGIVRFAVACKEQGVTPIVGAEVTLADGAHVVLLAKSAEGYTNLCRALTHAHMRGNKDKTHLPFAVLADHARGLIALSACDQGELRRALMTDGEPPARAVAHRYRDVFGADNYYVELHNHLRQIDGPRNAALVRVARAVGVGIVATNNAHYAMSDRALLHHVATAIRHRTTLDDAGDLLRPNDEYYLKTPAQMARLFRDYPEAIAATIEIADRCAFRLDDMTYQFPSPDVPEGETPHSWLVKCIEEGRRRYYPNADTAVRERLAYELSIVESLNLAGYLLVFKDIVDFCRRERILVSIRGSAPASALLYCLGLCPIDPVRHNLVFERFASLERDELPDIDLDIAHEDRERVIQYVYEKYTRERAAMVCEVNTYRLKSAVRDVAKALGVPHEQAVRLSTSLDERDLDVLDTPLAVAVAPDFPAGKNHGEVGVDRGAGGWSEVGREAIRPMASGSGETGAPSLATRRHPRDSTVVVARYAIDRAEPARGEPASHSPSANGEETRPRDGVTKTDPPSTVATGISATELAPQRNERGATDARSSRGRSAEGEVGTPRQERDAPGAAVERARSVAAVTGNLSAVRHLVPLVRQLLDAPRHLSIHVGGFVISARPLSDVLPVEPARMPGRSIIPWDKDDLTYLAEEFNVNLVKLDLLGLGMLSLTSRCFEAIEAKTGEPLDLHGFEYDEKVYDVICRGDTVGLFQIESRAQMAFLPRLRPRNLADVAISVGAIRPGPGAYQAGNHIARRRARLERVDYLAPELKGVLKETLGVVLWQEQVMQVAMIMAGYSGGEADKLRRAMSSKRSVEHMAEACRDLVERIVARGHPRALAENIKKMVAGFAGYGFPRAHAYPFAHLALISATLKLRYPAEFYVALLNCQPMGFYAPHTIVWDARRHGIRILPVDVNQSAWECTVEDERTIRLGLKEVDGLGPAARAAIEATRVDGPFRSLADFVARTGLPRDDLEALAGVGAFLPFADRRAALWQVGELAGLSGPRYLPGLAELLATPTTLPPMSEWEQAQADYERLGLSLDRHVMEYFRPALRAQRAVAATDLPRLPKNLIVRLGGLVIIRQRPGTARGFTFLTLEDETGLINVIIAPAVYRRQRAVIRGEPLLVVEGLLQKDDVPPGGGGAINVIARRFWPLEPDRTQSTTGPASHVPSRDFH